MNILMIYPEFPTNFWGLKHALRFVSKKSACPPLSLLTVAGMLPQEWELRLKDMNVERLKDKDLEWADYVMISAMLIQKTSVMDVLERCRCLGTRVIAGGPLFTSVTDEFLDWVDHLILDEAELTLPPSGYRADAFPPGDAYDDVDSRFRPTKLKSHALCMLN